ncbi:hypothetical protein Esti_003511 [Eimeria stiedai]
MNFAKGSPKQPEERQGLPEETQRLSDRTNPTPDVSDPEDEPAAKKEKRKAVVNAGETSMSGEPPDSENADIPESLLELFLKDTLQEAEESFCANRLVDFDEEVPPSPDPSEDTKDWLARTEMDPEKPAFPENLKLLEEATSSVSEQMQGSGAAQTPGGPHIPNGSISSSVPVKAESPVAVVE